MLKLFKTQKGGSAMVKRGKLLASAVLSALSVVALYGCGGGSGSNVSSNPTDGTVLLAKTGTLVVSAKFPTGNEPGQIGTALIDENTAKIVVVVFNESGYSEDVILTRDNPTARIANVPIGRMSVYITTYDSAYNLLDYLAVGGEIAEGENTLVATLIRGYWKFVDANGNPVSIRLNKTLDTDTTTLTGFSVIPYTYTYIDWDEPFAESEYNLLWKGSGFSRELCGGSTETCRDEGLSYFNQFIGPSTNNNAIDSQYLPLPKAGDYPRSAFIAGTAPEGMSNISDQDALNYFNSKVTGPNTMEGHIVELLIKSSTETLTCYDLSGNEITCPDTSSASKSNKGLSKAIAKAISQRAGKSAIGSDGCFRDLTISSTDEWESCADLDNDGRWCECFDYDNDGRWCEEGERSADDWFKVKADGTWTGDACVQPFKAEGRQLPSTDLDLTIQRKK